MTVQVIDELPLPYIPRRQLYCGTQVAPSTLGDVLQSNDQGMVRKFTFGAHVC